MPSRNYFNTGRVLSKKTAFLFVVLAAIFSLCIQNSAARQIAVAKGNCGIANFIASDEAAGRRRCKSLMSI